VRPALVHLAQIFVAKSSDHKRNKELKKAMRDMHGLLTKQPQSFSELAKKYSQNSVSKGKGGDMGWLKVNSLLPAIKQTIRKMAKNSISPVIRSDQGWHIVKLLERKHAGQTPFADARPALIKAMRATEQKRRIQQNINNMMSDKSISINPRAMELLAKSI